MSQNRPIQPPFFLPVFSAIPENAVKPFVSVRVENTPNSRPVCQNTAEIHLIKRAPVVV